MSEVVVINVVGVKFGIDKTICQRKRRPPPSLRRRRHSTAARQQAPCLTMERRGTDGYPDGRTGGRGIRKNRPRPNDERENVAGKEGVAIDFFRLLGRSPRGRPG